MSMEGRIQNGFVKVRPVPETATTPLLEARYVQILHKVRNSLKATLKMNFNNLHKMSTSTNMKRGRLDSNALTAYSL